PETPATLASISTVVSERDVVKAWVLISVPKGSINQPILKPNRDRFWNQTPTHSASTDWANAPS
ncbi:MAG TPA: hypothetical protein VI816_04365, partial [Candidatus Bathyarchaeia archaeon]|nr:hypothetical protein [Candidatus Bathyarchaeia archaeon]